jgi:DNA-binding response OmpR family regulator
MKGRRILVIDDDRALVKLVATVLEQEGCEVNTAFDGAEGLKIIRRTTPDLIILDMNMPRMGGISFYHEIANSYDGSPDIPVRVMTGRGALEEVFRGFNVDGFLAKPFEIAKLVEAVRDILKKRHGGEPAAQKRRQARRIMLVEDDAETFDALAMQLLRDGHEVVREANIYEVPIRTAAQRIDAVLMKLGSLSLMGPEVMIAARIEQNPVTSKVPVILYAAGRNNMDELDAAGVCAKAGVHSLVQYSDLNQVAAEVDRVLKLSQERKMNS